MAISFRIQVMIRTADIENAGTNGRVFLGFGGTEYHLDSDPHDNFEPGSVDLFHIGDDNNLKWAKYQLSADGFRIPADFPMYIRLEPTPELSDWAVTYVVVQGHDKFYYGHDFNRNSNDTNYCWLGKVYGNYIWLHADPAFERIFIDDEINVTNK